MGLESCSEIAKQIGSFAQSLEVQKRPINAASEVPEDLQNDVELLATQQVKAIFYDTTLDKDARGLATFKVRDEVTEVCHQMV